jgi:hypothetical protein
MNRLQKNYIRKFRYRKVSKYKIEKTMLENFFNYIGSIKVPLTAVIAIYAALVSTFMAAVKIYEIIDSKRLRLKVKAQVASQMLVFKNGDTGRMIKLYYVNMYNPGKVKIKIDQPKITIPQPGRKWQTVSLLDIQGVLKSFPSFSKNVNYPHILGPNDSVEFVIPASSINDTFVEQNIDKFRFIVTDATGNAFKSNKIKPAGLGEPPWQPTDMFK